MAHPGKWLDPQVFRAAPHFEAAGRRYAATEVVERLTPFLSDERRARIGAVIAQRTRTIVPVLEGLYDWGNVSAVMRSAEGLGYQELHVIDNCPNFKEAARVTQGAEKWVDVEQWDSTAKCIESLRGEGRQIAVAHLGPNAVPLRDLDPTRPLALVLGNEHAGPSEELLGLADVEVVIPMSGFVESFNISVAAALCLYDFRERRIAALGHHGDLRPDEITELTAAFYLRALPHALEILAHTK